MRWEQLEITYVFAGDIILCVRDLFVYCEKVFFLGGGGYCGRPAG